MKHDQPCENEPAPQVPNKYVLWSSHLSPKNMSRPLGLPFSLGGLSLADGFPGIIPKKIIQHSLTSMTEVVVEMSVS